MHKIVNPSGKLEDRNGDVKPFSGWFDILFKPMYCVVLATNSSFLSCWCILMPQSMFDEKKELIRSELLCFMQQKSTVLEFDDIVTTLRTSMRAMKSRGGGQRTKLHRFQNTDTLRLTILWRVRLLFVSLCAF